MPNGYGLWPYCLVTVCVSSNTYSRGFLMFAHGRRTIRSDLTVALLWSWSRALQTLCSFKGVAFLLGSYWRSLISVQHTIYKVQSCWYFSGERYYGWEGREILEEGWEDNNWFIVIRLQRQVLRQGNYFTACATVIISPLCMLRMAPILMSEPQLKQITHVLTDWAAQNEFKENKTAIAQIYYSPASKCLNFTSKHQ